MYDMCKNTAAVTSKVDVNVNGCTKRLKASSETFGLQTGFGRLYN